MLQQSSRKKSGSTSKDALPRSKRPKIDRKKPLRKTSSENLAVSSSSLSETKKKGKQSVSFAPAEGSKKSSVKSVRIREAHDSTSVSFPGKGKAPAGKVKAQAKPTRTAPAAPTPAPLPRAFTIVVGSYEKLLYGVQGTYPPSFSSTPTLKPVFIFPAHVASVKAVAASPDGGKWLATGSSDEIIKVWDLRRKKEVGGLMQHQGSITHLSFASRSHLISASEDGTIALFHARDWTVLLTLKGHKGRVNSVAVHPTGKVALSVGKDRALRMWDLMRGKPSASTMLGKEAELVRWSRGGREFVVQTGDTVDVYRTDMTLLQTIKHPSRIQDVRFGRHPDQEDSPDADEFIFVSAEDRKVSVYARRAEFFSVDEDEESESEEETEKEASGKTAYGIVAELVGHANRVKAIDMLTIALPPTPTPTPSSSASRTQTTILASASSDGLIHVYDLAALPLPLPSSSSSSSSEKVTIVDPVAKYDTKGTRLTCLTLAASVPPPPPPTEEVGGFTGVKRGREDEEEVEEELEDEDEDEDEDEAE